jgi:hypothetical protein
MPSGLRLPATLMVALTLAATMLAAGCSRATLPGADDSNSSGTTGDGETAVGEGTCWAAARLGDDPQDVLTLSGRFHVDYLVAARALAGRPSFGHRVDCGDDHAVEVYRVLRLPKLDEQLTDYATLLRIQTPLYAEVARSVARGCMSDGLAKAATETGLPGAVMAPALPHGASLGWAPAAPDEWTAGRRVFACTLTWDDPQSIRYATVFTRHFPTGKRTCIDSHVLAYVDCARRHDRERIAVIEARDAVAAGDFPGPKAIRKGPNGRYLKVSDARWRRLDAACTSYLRTVSTTKKLTGVANVDVDEWPVPGGSYPIYCEADTRPDQDSLITEGSVYNRG